MDHLNQFQQVYGTKPTPACCEDDKRILGSQACPIRRHGAQTLILVMKVNTILTPGLVNGCQFELAPA
jgi:hypothetical protein